MFEVLNAMKHDKYRKLLFVVYIAGMVVGLGKSGLLPSRDKLGNVRRRATNLSGCTSEHSGCTFSQPATVTTSQGGLRGAQQPRATSSMHPVLNNSARQTSCLPQQTALSNTSTAVEPTWGTVDQEVGLPIHTADHPATQTGAVVHSAEAGMVAGPHPIPTVLEADGSGSKPAAGKVGQQAVLRKKLRAAGHSSSSAQHQLPALSGQTHTNGPHTVEHGEAANDAATPHVSPAEDASLSIGGRLPDHACEQQKTHREKCSHSGEGNRSAAPGGARSSHSQPGTERVRVHGRECAWEVQEAEPRGHSSALAEQSQQGRAPHEGALAPADEPTTSQHTTTNGLNGRMPLRSSQAHAQGAPAAGQGEPKGAKRRRQGVRKSPRHPAASTRPDAEPGDQDQQQGELGASREQVQQQGRGVQPAGWTRRKRQRRSKAPNHCKYAGLVGRVVEIPASVFSVDVPGMFYRGAITKREGGRKQEAMEVKFLEDGSRYWFPLASLREWLEAQDARQARPETGDAQRASQADEFAAEVLTDLASDSLRQAGEGQGVSQASDAAMSCQAKAEAAIAEPQALPTAAPAAAAEAGQGHGGSVGGVSPGGVAQAAQVSGATVTHTGTTLTNSATISAGQSEVLSGGQHLRQAATAGGRAGQGSLG